MRTTSILAAVLSASLLGCGSVTGGDQADAFVDQRPLVSSVAPEHGPAGGGITLTITGTNFDNGEAQVVVGGRVATDVTVVSDTQITATLPPGEQEAQVTLTVFNDGGTANLLQAFTYNPAPVVAQVSPELGSASGGTTITITGSGFADGPAVVTIDGEPATSVVIVDDSTITASTPALGDRPAYVHRDVVVENPNGVTVLPGAFRYKRVGLLMGRQSNYRADFEPMEDRTLLYYVDLVARETVPLFEVWWGIKALDVHADGTLYALTNRRNIFNKRYLLRIDPLTEEVTPVGQLVMAGTTTECKVTDMAFNGATLYAWRRYYLGSPTYVYRSLLTTINTSTGECTDVSAAEHSILISGGVGIALKDANTFYLLDNHQGTIYQVNTSNAEVGSPVTMTHDLAQRCAGLTLTGGTLFSLGRYDSNVNGQLLSINPVTGLSTVVLDSGVPYYAKGLSRTPPSMN